LEDGAAERRCADAGIVEALFNVWTAGYLGIAEYSEACGAVNRGVTGVIGEFGGEPEDEEYDREEGEPGNEDTDAPRCREVNERPENEWGT
jgi:hypothetical protein